MSDGEFSEGRLCSIIPRTDTEYSEGKLCLAFPVSDGECADERLLPTISWSDREACQVRQSSALHRFYSECTEGWLCHPDTRSDRGVYEGMLHLAIPSSVKKFSEG